MSILVEKRKMDGSQIWKLQSGHDFVLEKDVSQNLLFSISKDHNSKNTQSSVMVLALCKSAHVALHLYKLSWKYLERFLSYRADTILWQTDRRPREKQYVSQP